MDDETRQHEIDRDERMEPVTDDRMMEAELREEEIRARESRFAEGERQPPVEEPVAADRMGAERRENRQVEQGRHAAAMEKELVPLLVENEAQEFRSRWLDIQAEFVDDPHNSVEKADELVAQVINSITENFAGERSSLEDQWNRGQEASTEDLRLAMKRYRSFFNRLLTLEASGTAE
jgi:hypothetical protein